MRKMRSILRAQKTVVEENYTKGVSPTVIFWNPSRPQAFDVAKATS